jgi:putative acetyltransferase
LVDSRGGLVTGFTLERTDFGSDEIVRLADAQQAEMRGRYEGVADIGPTRVADMFEPPDGAFLVVRDDDGHAVGCGGVCRFDETRAELKRMYVVPAARGQGLGRRLLVELEEHARSFGYEAIVLETGDRQPESFGLYMSAGYERIPCYPPYSERSLSLCFEKRL